MAINDIVKADCDDCGHDRNHRVLQEERRSASAEENYAEVHQIIECCGCERRSFCHTIEDYDAGWMDEYGDFQYPSTISIYPQVYTEVKILERTWNIPKEIRGIYEETFKAVESRSYIMAGVGLRAIIEGICTDKKVSGRTLDVRISNLAKNKIITDADASFLHGIRFAGNDAAHGLKALSARQVLIGLRIVNGLLYGLYLRDPDNSGALETPIENVEDLAKALKQTIAKLSTGEELAFDALLGKNKRRIPKDNSTLSDEFEKAVAAGEIRNLELGKVATPTGSAKPIQLFRRV